MKQLKQLFILLTLIALLLFMLKIHLENKRSEGFNNTVNFYNWGDYIDPELLKEFEAETGYQVVYETFDSNEAMMTKIQQGGTAYDVVVPSEYMIDSMIEKKLLTPIDHNHLPHLSNIDPRFLNQSFDPDNKYSVPYFWGTLGILYHTDFIHLDDINHWDKLWNPKFKDSLLMYDGAREVMGIGLQTLGYSLNEVDSHRLKEASEKMKNLMPNVRALVADEIKIYMAQEEAKLAVTFSGEAAMAMEKNKKLAYYVPTEGSNIWFDNLVIPITAQNIAGAYALIDFLMRPDIAARNAEYIGYSTPNKSALSLMPKEITQNSTFYPDDEVISHLEVYKNIGHDKLIEYNDYFLDIKIAPR